MKTAEEYFNSHSTNNDPETVHLMVGYARLCLNQVDAILKDAESPEEMYTAAEDVLKLIE